MFYPFDEDVVRAKRGTAKYRGPSPFDYAQVRMTT
jgi:hypothetical protein